MDSRPDVLMSTGRSDYPNQINNVIGFPYISRGALNDRARAINEEMKMAAVHAIADLAKQTCARRGERRISRKRPHIRS